MMAITLFGVSMPIFWPVRMLILPAAVLAGFPSADRCHFGGGKPPRAITGMSCWSDSLWQAIQKDVGGIASSGAAGLHVGHGAVGADHAHHPCGGDDRRQLRSRSHCLCEGPLGPRVILRHVLRNAAIPIVTVIGLQLGLLLSGAVLTETIFSLPGIEVGLAVDLILSRDYPVVQAGALFIAALFVVVNLVVDLSYTLLDPRIARP